MNCPSERRITVLSGAARAQLFTTRVYHWRSESYKTASAPASCYAVLETEPRVMSMERSLLINQMPSYAPYKFRDLASHSARIETRVS